VAEFVGAVMARLLAAQRRRGSEDAGGEEDAAFGWVPGPRLRGGKAQDSPPGGGGVAEEMRRHVEMAFARRGCREGDVIVAEGKVMAAAAGSHVRHVLWRPTISVNRPPPHDLPFSNDYVPLPGNRVLAQRPSLHGRQHLHRRPRLRPGGRILGSPREVVAWNPPRKPRPPLPRVLRGLSPLPRQKPASPPPTNRPLLRASATPSPPSMTFLQDGDYSNTEDGFTNTRLQLDIASAKTPPTPCPHAPPAAPTACAWPTTPDQLSCEISNSVPRSTAQPRKTKQTHCPKQIAFLKKNLATYNTETKGPKASENQAEAIFASSLPLLSSPHSLAFSCVTPKAPKPDPDLPAKPRLTQSNRPQSHHSHHPSPKPPTPNRPRKPKEQPLLFSPFRGDSVSSPCLHVPPDCFTGRPETLRDPPAQPHAPNSSPTRDHSRQP